MNRAFFDWKMQNANCKMKKFWIAKFEFKRARAKDARAAKRFLIES